MGVRPGESPLIVVLPLLIILAYFAFWLLIIAGGVWLVLSLGLRMGVVGPAVHETPLDILKARYARGEISKAQYQELKQDLSDPQS
jgi:putative membrane protein